MSLVMLKNTSNPNYKYLEGRIGDLTILDNGRFAFEFTDTDGSKKTLSSSIQGRLGIPGVQAMILQSLRII